MHSRTAKDNALKAIKSSTDTVEVDDDIEQIENTNNAKSYFVPRTSQNAPEGFSLDLFKQYKRKAEFCDRDLLRIHDRDINKRDKGSEDRGLVYIDFQAGIFEALKLNFLKCIERNFNTVLI